jgi:hypothetical protein
MGDSCTALQVCQWFSSFSGSRPRLTFDGLLDRSYGLVVEVDAEYAGVAGELEDDPLDVGAVAGAVLGSEPETHEDLVARRGCERP